MHVDDHMHSEEEEEQEAEYNGLELGWSNFAGEYESFDEVILLHLQYEVQY